MQIRGLLCALTIFFSGACSLSLGWDRRGCRIGPYRSGTSAIYTRCGFLSYDNVSAYPQEVKYKFKLQDTFF